MHKIEARKKGKTLSPTLDLKKLKNVELGRANKNGISKGFKVGKKF